MEVETQLQIAANLGYLPPKETATLLTTTAELGKILNGLLASVSGH